MAVFTIGSKTLSGSPTGGAVGGASNLTTVGAIPYVSASGVLNQDATKLFWDSANSRLGVGTASPSVTLQSQGVLGVTGGAASYPTGVGGVYSHFTSNVGTIIAVTSGTAGRQLNLAGEPLTFSSSQTALELARFAATTGNLLIGGTTDGNYKLDVQKSGSTGTLRVYDQTATTGVSTTVFRNGAGQSTTEAIQFQISDGSVRGRILTDNAIFGSQFYYYTDLNATFRLGNIASALLELNTSGMIQFSSTAAYNGTKDLGLSRNAAGVLEINNGTPGTLRDLKLRNITVMDTTAVTGSTLAVIQAGAGQSGNLLSVRNNAGTEISSISATGGVFGSALYVATGAAGEWGPSAFKVPNNSKVGFVNGTNATAAVDTAIMISASGILEINNGTAGTLRDLLLRYLQNTGVTVATLPAAAAGNAGSRAYVTDANATTIGSTVAGGGSNKVMVWSNGTNWKIYAS